MFGANEAIAKTRMRELQRAADCKGEHREWCRNEYRAGPRYG